MSYETTEHLTISAASGNEVEVELTCVWQSAEPDVGLMADWIDDFKVTVDNGSSRHAAWVDKVIAKHDDLVNAIIERIYDGQ